MIETMSKIVILAAEEAEYGKCLQWFPEYECRLMGVGAGNVIKTCSALPEGTKVVNVGYAGSNLLPIGTIVAVGESYRLVKGSYNFVDHANPLPLGAAESEDFPLVPCYTNNDFVTESDLQKPAVFDMELNYIAAFSPRIELLGSIKVVSDNLSIDAFRNNALRESGILTSDDVWKRVRECFDKQNF